MSTARIISTEQLTATHTAFEIEAPDIVSSAEPGQHALLRIGGATVFLPHVVTDVDRDKGVFTIVARTSSNDDTAEDTGTAAVELSGLVGRAGPVRGTKALLVAEGFGIPAVLPRLRDYKEYGAYTIVVAGYPSKDFVFWTDRLNSFADEMYVVTDDGSFGIKGPVKHTVRAICENVPDIDRAIAIGPIDLLKGCVQASQKYGIPATISLSALVHQEAADSPEERRLVDVISRMGWDKATDLDGQEVDFDNLTQQLGIQISK
jgi:ferredoxin--NADP+ reductase